MPHWLVIFPSTLTLKVSTQLSLLKTLFYHFLYFSRKLWKPQQCNINCTEHFWAILLDRWPVRVVRKPHTLCLILHCDCEIKICNIVTFLFILNIMWLEHSILIGRFIKWPLGAVSLSPSRKKFLRFSKTKRTEKEYILVSTFGFFGHSICTYLINDDVVQAYNNH